MPTPEELERLRRASEKSAGKARDLLDEEVKSLLAEVARLGELRPSTADEETYNELVKVIEEATARNASIATVKENVEKVGSSAVALFKQMASLAKGLK